MIKWGIYLINVYSDIIQFNGSHYDFGFKQGKLLKDSFLLANRKKQWFSKKHHFIINKKQYETIIQQFASSLWEELHGLADALKIEMTEAIREFGGYYLEYGRSGCTIFTGFDYMIRNYDNHPLTYEGRYIIYKPTDSGYATIGPSMQITGRTDGMNEKGLAIGYNFINRKGSKDGFICNMIGRIILETCANVDEAISLLKEIPHRHSFSYVVLDQSGKTYVVECSPRSVVVRQANVCTNHFEYLIEENRYRMEDSLRRQHTILQEQNSLINWYEAFQMMNDPNKGVFSTKYGAWSGTLHTSIYRPQTMQVGFAIGGNRDPLIFNFNDWINGKSFKVKQIKGKLDTDTPFVHMTKL